jgi:hypothetical protein
MRGGERKEGPPNKERGDCMGCDPFGDIRSMQSCFAVSFSAAFASAVLIGSSVLSNCPMPGVVLSQVFYQLVLVIVVVHSGTCYF